MPLTLSIAESEFLNGEYEQARKRLVETAAADKDEDPEISLALGRVLMRLGDLEQARTRLDKASAAIRASGRTGLMPGLSLAVGELEQEAGTPAGLAHFHTGAAAWVDDMPDPASVEATCLAGFLEASAGHLDVGITKINKGAAKAEKMARRNVESRCRLLLGRVYFMNRRYKEAVETLNTLRPGPGRELGRERDALVSFWRGQALQAAGDLSLGASEIARGRDSLDQLRRSIPSVYQMRFSARPDIRDVFPERVVQNSGQRR
jgi:uncharacterized protein HemY